MKESLKKAKAKYQREKVRSIKVDIYPTEQDIKDKLEAVKTNGEFVATYIKRLIREDIRRGNEN